MTLPNFLGVGAARSGSTWLHYLLASHPAIYVPEQRKELNYFDKLYDQRPLSWYQTFFPEDQQSSQYRAIGEITPTYLYCDTCPQRIHALGSVDKLIVILRNPIDRAYSQYGLQVRDYAHTITFEEALRVHKQLIDRGMYAKHLQNYLRVFDRSQLLVLCFERAVRDVADTKQQIAAFLDLDVTQFTESVPEQNRNASKIPRFGKTYARMAWLSRRLRRHDLDWVANFGRRLGIKRLISSNRRLPDLSATTRDYLTDVFHEDVQQLYTLFPMDCVWSDFAEA